MNSNSRFVFLVVAVIAAVLAVWFAIHSGSEEGPPEPAANEPRSDKPEAASQPQPAALPSELDFPTDDSSSAPRAEHAPQRATFAPEVDALTIQGHVVDVHDEPVAEAVVAAYHPKTAALRATTDAEGMFSVRVPRRELYRLSAEKEHYNRTVKEKVHSGTGGIVLILEERSRVTGTVVRADTGDPLTRFDLVYLEIPPGNRQHWGNISRAQDTAWMPFQDPEGAFLVEDVVSRQMFALGARAEGFEPDFVELPPVEPAAEATDVLIALLPEAIVSGRVVTAAKDPIPGASLHLGEDVKRHPVAYTDSAGQFEIGGLGDEEVLVSAAHPDYLPGSTRVQPARGANVEIEITLGQGGSIEGVVSRAGEPMAGQLVIVSRLTGERFHKQATTDQTGHYAVLGVPPGEVEAMVQIRAEDNKAPMRLQRKAAVEQEGVTIVDFDFPAVLGTLEGIVTVNGEPPAEGRVKLTVTSDSGDSIYTATIRDDGHYAMESIAPGTGWLEASVTSQGGAQLQKTLDIAVSEGDQLRQDIAFDAQNAIYGEISGFDASRHGVVVAVQGEVNVDPTDVAQLLELERANVSQTQINEDGTYRLEGVPPGEYTVIAITFSSQADTGNDVLSSTRVGASPVTLEEGQHAQANLVLE